MSQQLPRREKEKILDDILSQYGYSSWNEDEAMEAYFVYFESENFSESEPECVIPKNEALKNDILKAIPGSFVKSVDRNY